MNTFVNLHAGNMELVLASIALYHFEANVDMSANTVHCTCTGIFFLIDVLGCILVEYGKEVITPSPILFKICIPGCLCDETAGLAWK